MLLSIYNLNGMVYNSTRAIDRAACCTIMSEMSNVTSLQFCVGVCQEMGSTVLYSISFKYPHREKSTSVVWVIMMAIQVLSRWKTVAATFSIVKVAL